MLNVTEIKDNKYKVEILSKEISYFITNRCINKCLHCNPKSGKSLNIESDYLEIIENFKFFKNYWNIDIISLLGGEPLLKPNFNLIYADAIKNFKINLFSTGFGLSNNIRSLLKDFKPYQYIASLYGLKVEHNSFCKNNKAFDIVIDSLKFFMSLNIVVTINIVNNKNNFHIINEIVSFIFSNNLANKIKILNFSPLGRGLHNNMLTPSNSEKVQMISKLRNHIEKNNIYFINGIDVQRDVAFNKKDQVNIISCPLITFSKLCFISNIHITADGNIFPCVTLINNPNFRLGSIRNGRITYNNEYFNKINSFKNSYIGKTCNFCTNKDYCFKGCLGFRLSNLQDFRCEEKKIVLGCPVYYTPLKL